MRNRIGLIIFSGLAIITFFGLNHYEMPGSVLVSTGGLVFAVVSQRAMHTFLENENFIDGDTGSPHRIDFFFSLAPGIAYFA